MRVRPATAELKVRDPERGGHLPPAGDDVPDTEYWRRRLADGDLVLAPDDAAEPPAGRATKGRE